jgi:hypothetical protein
VAVKFNNTQQGFVVLSPTGLLQNTAQASVSAWVYLSALYGGTGVGASIIDVGNANNYSRMDLLVLPDGAIHLGARAPDSMDTQQVKTSVTRLVVDQWYHIVGVIDYNANTGAIYINGVNDNATGTLSFPNRATDNTVCYATSLGGNELSDNEFITGVIDDARFYNRVLREDEIQTLYACRGNDSIFYGLQSRWLMNEGAKDQQIGQFDPIAINNVQSAQSSVTASSLTLAYTVPAGSDLVLVVVATAEDSSSGSVSVSNMTFGGAALASQASTRTTSYFDYCGVAIWSKTVTAGQSGNIVVTFGGTADRRTVMACVLSGVASATNEASATSYNNSGTTTTGLTTLTPGAMVITGCVNEDGYVMTAVGTNHVLDATIVGGAHAGAMGHVLVPTIGAISDIGFTASPTPNGEALALAAFAPHNTLGSTKDLSDFQYVASVSRVPTYEETFMKTRR